MYRESALRFNQILCCQEVSFSKTFAINPLPQRRILMPALGLGWNSNPPPLDHAPPR